MNANTSQRIKPASITLDDERVRPGASDHGTVQHHLSRYEFARRWLKKDFDVLELACGTGYGTRVLAQAARSVVAVDLSLAALSYARQEYPAANLTYASMDCQQLAVPENRFDRVVSFEVFEHLNDQPGFLRECRRVLRPGGALILSTPNHVTSTIHMQSIQQHNPFHIGEVDLPALRKLLDAAFPRHTIYGQRRRGNPIYEALRALDIFNLRLRLFSNRRRENLQSRFGVSTGTDCRPQDYVFKTSQLRQCSNFVAVCWKEK